MTSTLGWCPDACEIPCWNGETVRLAFIIDAFDRESIAPVAVTGAGISGSDVCNMRLAAAEKRFGTDRIPPPVEPLSNNGSWDTAAGTRDFAPQLGLVSCFTPVRPPERREARMAEAFVKTLKRDHVRVTPLPDAVTVPGLVSTRINDHNTIHPHPAPAMRSPAASRSALNHSQAVR